MQELRPYFVIAIKRKIKGLVKESSECHLPSFKGNGIRKYRGLSEATKDFLLPLYRNAPRKPTSYILEKNYRDVYPLIKAAIRIFISSREKRRPFLLHFNGQECRATVRYLLFRWERCFVCLYLFFEVRADIFGINGQT